MPLSQAQWLLSFSPLLSATLAAPVGNPAEGAAVKYIKLSPEVAHLTMTHMVAAKLWSDGAFVQSELDGIADALRLTGDAPDGVDWAKLTEARASMPAAIERVFIWFLLAAV